MTLPSGTVTFLFNDIDVSTQLWGGYPEAMKAAQARHEIILHEVGYTRLLYLHGNEVARRPRRVPFG